MQENLKTGNTETLGMSGEKLMIANQSVQQIGEVGHVQEDDGEDAVGSQQNFGVGYQSKHGMGHNDSYG